MSWIERAKAAKPQSLGEWILFAIALCVYPFARAKEWLAEVTYRKFDGGVRAALGHLLGFAGGIYVAWYAGWQLEWGYLSWLAAGIATWPLTKWYIWPVGYWLVIHPVWWTANKIWDGLRYAAKHYLSAFLNGILNVLRCLPGSNALWTKVLDDGTPENPDEPRYRDESWVQKLLYVLTFPTAAFICGKLGWFVYESVFGAFDLPLINWAAGIGAGFFVFLFSAGILWNWFEHGKVPALAVTTGGAATYFGAGYIALAASAVGITGIGVWAAYALALALWTAYLYPAADWFFRNGIEWCWKQLKPSIRETYDEKDKSYAGFFHHVTNLVVGYFVFVLSLGLCNDLGLSAALAYSLASLATLLGYIGVFKLLDEDNIGNGITGAALSLGAGYKLGSWWQAGHQTWALNDYVSIGVGVFAAFVTGFIVFPVAYCLLRAGLRYIGLHAPLNTFFAWVYGGVDRGFRWVGKKLEVIYTWSYRDKHAYAEFFLHGVNLVATYFAATYLYALTGSWSVFAAWPAIVVGAGLLYLILGKILTKSGYGIEFVGGVASLAAAITVGAHVEGLYHVWYVSGIVAVAAGCVTFAVGFPAAYWIVKAPGWVLSLVLQRPVVGLHAFAWSKFEGIANKFAAVYQWLVEALAPYFAVVGAFFARIKAMYDRIRNTLTGK